MILSANDRVYEWEPPAGIDTVVLVDGIPALFTSLDRMTQGRVARLLFEAEDAEAETLLAAGSFNPAQARVPRGNDNGGEWVDTPGGVLGDLEGARDISLTGPGAVMTMPEGVDLDPILVEAGWTMDPETREVSGPPKEDIEHWDPSEKYGQPGPPQSYLELAQGGVNVNPGASDPGGDVNCQRTATAMEMRARGYDVVAPPAKGKDGQVFNLEANWVDDKGRHPIISIYKQPNATASIAALGPDVKPGQRFLVAGFNRETGFGHAWNAEVKEDGSIFEWDPQANDEMHSEFYGLNEVHVMRVDHLEPTKTMSYNGGRQMPPWVLSQQDYIYFQNGNL